jgi:hypothetical protein
MPIVKFGGTVASLISFPRKTFKKRIVRNGLFTSGRSDNVSLLCVDLQDQEG